MKYLLSIFSTVTFILLHTQTANSQIMVTSKLSKKDYLAYEDVKLSVSITNRSGQQINFSNKRRSKWVEFIVQRGGKDSVFVSQESIYEPLQLGAGDTKVSNFGLNNDYDLSQPGNYSVYAIVRMPGQNAGQGTRSNKVYFTVINGFAAWKQRAGVPGTVDETREYRIINLTSNGRTELYAQVEDLKRGKMLATYSMGNNLAFREFTATLDNNNCLHVLFLTMPTIYSHTMVDTTGKTVRRLYHKKGQGGNTPKLVTTGSGVVGVINSTPYDPHKIQDLRSKIHNLSELPLGL